MADPKAEITDATDERKVLIRGHVFDYAEKAPFVASGVSVLGAIEIDAEGGAIRCHECGEWHVQLPFHSVRKHGLSSREYKERHGLLYQTSLVSPQLQEQKRAANRAVNSVARLGSRKGNKLNGVFNGATARKRGSPDELRNEQGRCQAQTLFRIRTIAAQLGHTPTVAELKANGVHPSSIRHRFGVTSLTPVMQMAGLSPNTQGNPTEQKFNDRMPWPKEYFGVSPIALEQRRT